MNGLHVFSDLEAARREGFAPFDRYTPSLVLVVKTLHHDSHLARRALALANDPPASIEMKEEHHV